MLTLSAEADKAAARWTDNGLYQVAEELQHELAKVDNVGVDLHRRRQPQPDPRRARPRAPLALRHHAQPARRQARQRQPLVPGRRVSRRRQVAAGGRRPDAAGRSRHRPAAADLARRPAGLRQGRRQCRRRRGRARASRLDDDAHAARRAASGGRRSAWRSPSARAPTPSRSPTSCSQRLETVKGRIVPATSRSRSRATTARRRPKRPTSCCSISALATLSIVVLITLAIGWREGVVVLDHHPDHDPADAVRLLADGLHDQPRQPVRADLLDRHPRRRRHRRGREHRPALVDARRARPRRDRGRGGRRSRQSDHRRDADHRRRAAADDVRQRPDGPLHEPDPGQRLDRRCCSRSSSRSR